MLDPNSPLWLIPELLANIKLAAEAKPATKTSPKPPAALAQLLQAKFESDRGNYPAKAAIIQRLIQANPDHFMIDSMNQGIAGVTHTPTSFRIHLLQKQLPAALLQLEATR